MTSDISALMDGEMDPDEAARTLASMRQDRQLRETWAIYHLIGDGLRGSAPLDLDLTVAVSRRLAQEPTVLAPSASPEAKPARFALAAVAASLAAVSLVGLLALQLARPGAAPTGTASLATAPSREGEAGSVAKLTPSATQGAAHKAGEPAPAHFPPAAGDAYLLAHQEFSPSYAMAGLPAYVRAVSEQDPGQ